MNHRTISSWPYALLVLFIAVTGSVHAQTDEESKWVQAISDLGANSRSKILSAVEALGGFGDPRALPALEALEGRRLVVDQEGRVLIQVNQKALIDPISGSRLSSEGLKLQRPRINNAVRRALKSAIARLQLFSPNLRARLEAATDLIRRPSKDAEPALRRALARETHEQVREALTIALAQLDLDSEDKQRRLAAIRSLGEAGNLRFQALLERILEKGADGHYRESDEEIRKAARRALASIHTQQLLIAQAGNLFYGLSLGSVLLLAALGLAITFGLMGVINMAHGEMLMLGAYSTFTVQNLFKTFLPDLFGFYLLAAIPAAFLVSGAVGILLERTIIRYLYGRPLETLLATWGIGLILIQTVRLIFGAQNVEVANPGWLSGGMVIAQGLVLTYNRIATIIFAVLVVALVWLLFQRTRLGLNVRAVTQNRTMAAAMGINTHRVDMWTFGLGSAIAGLGGVALAQLGNVGPELGQAYIVDSFMVVVLGGVGKIAGAVAGALTLGLVNKFLEPATGAVLGKIMVLIFIILFIQKRPQGMFALKGRAAES